MSPRAVSPPADNTLRSHGRAVLVLGLPLIGSHLAQVALQVTDTLMLGWFSVEALAAAVLGAMLFFTLFVMGAGIAWAVMPMVAHANAAGETAELRRITRMGLWQSVLFSGAVMPVMWWSGPLLVAAGQEPQIAALTQEYLRIMGWGMAPALLVMVLKSYLAALERAQMVLWVTVVAALLNILLNWVLIFGNLGVPALGLRGAAIGSVIVQLFSIGLLVAYAGLLPELRAHALFLRLWRPDWPGFWRLFRLAWPISLTNLAESGLFAASAILMGWLGTHELAAHGIAIEITSIVFMVHLGLSNAATVRAGSAMGRGDGTALRRGALMAVALSVCFALLTMVVYLGFPAQMTGLFLTPEDPARDQVIAIGVGLLAVAAVFQLADGAQVVALGLLRGMQDTRVPMIMAAISYWLIGIPASWLLGIRLGYGGMGVWAGLVVGLVLAGSLLMLRFWSRARRV
ncbi:MATE family efflux transporter [Alkalilacustris brevis]|uniref:MATE family efflux transporter n=1 Tax=Alkalilacustris brevis TaxID=2026338 RepID=UPI000E0D417F|nr:MATE family efflux transporter [Alkalilacustris brevis]